MVTKRSLTADVSDFSEIFTIRDRIQNLPHHLRYLRKNSICSTAGTAVLENQSLPGN